MRQSVKDKIIIEAEVVNLIFRYIDDAMSSSNQNLDNCIHLIHLIQTKKTETASTALFLHIYLKFTQQICYRLGTPILYIRFFD
jgi:hypothetical protein